MTDCPVCGWASELPCPHPHTKPTAPLTDREAILKLASQLHSYLLGVDQSEVRRRLVVLIDDLAEPAAPMVACAGCGAAVAVKDLLHHDDAQAKPTAPTVTREQAEWMASAARMSFHLRRDTAPNDKEMPAFFRAVADALEGE